MSTTTWQFNTSAWVVVVALLFVAASVWFFFRSMKRETGGKWMKALHLLRLGISFLIALTLMRPERVVETRSNEQPRVAVLWDASGSMATNDVLGPDGQPGLRSAWLKQQVDAEFWKPLEKRYKVSVESFAQPPSDNDTIDVETQVGTNLNDPLERVMKQYGDLRAVLMLTDGDWNLGKNPLEAASTLSKKQISAFTLGIGSETFLPDVEILAVTAPSYGLINERVTAMATVQSRLPREVRTTITIQGPGETKAIKQVTIPAMGQVQEMLLFAPQIEGSGEFTVTIPIEKEDVFPENNKRTFPMSVRKETLKVLVVDSLPRWEFRYLRNALMRDPGVDVKCVLYHPQLGMGEGSNYLSEFPAKKEDLQGFDVIFLGDVGINKGQLTTENAEMIRGLIDQQASGLVFLPGVQGYQKSLIDSPLGDLIPVEMDYSKGVGFATPAESKLDLTMHGTDHWLTMLASDPAANKGVWRGLPGFYWYAPVTKAKKGTDVLAVHEVVRNANGRIPLLVTSSFGNGKVLFMGTDAAWRWRKGVEDTYHYRLWGQVVRWMSHQRHLAQEEGVRFFFSPEAPRRGDRVKLNATILDKLGVPLNGGRVTINLTAPSGTTETLELLLENKDWGVFTGEFRPREGGKYVVEIKGGDGDFARTMKTTINATIPTLEKVGQPMKGDILREIAGFTGGKYGTVNELAEILSSINLLPEPKPEERRLRLWCHPVWCAALIGLFTLYWVGRKLGGLS